MDIQKRAFVKKARAPFAVNTTMGFLVGGIPALLPLISDEFGLSRSQVGLYTTFMFLSSVSVALFAGHIVDVLGVKRCLMFGGIVSGVFVALFSTVPNYMVFLLLAVGLGFGQSILTPAGNKAIISAKSGKVSNMLMGFFRSTLGIGSLTGAAVLPLVAVNYGWRTATLLGGIIGVGVTLLVTFRGFEKTPRGTSEKTRKGSFKQSVKALIEAPTLRFLMITGFCFATVFSISITYIALWLRDVGGLSEYHSALGLAMAHSGGVVGRPLLGFLSDRVKRLRPVNILILDALSVTLILTSFALFGEIMSGPVLLVLCFILGLTAMGFGGVFFGFLGAVAGQEQAGVATGLILMFVRTAILVAPPLFGFMVDSLDSYNLPWFLIGLVTVVPIIYHLLRSNKKNTLRSDEAKP